MEMEQTNLTDSHISLSCFTSLQRDCNAAKKKKKMHSHNKQ